MCSWEISVNMDLVAAVVRKVNKTGKQVEHRLLKVWPSHPLFFFFFGGACPDICMHLYQDIVYVSSFIWVMDTWT